MMTVLNLNSISPNIPSYFQNEDFTDEKIQFGIEAIYIDGWMRRKMYDAFKEVLESGVRHHLQVRRTNCSSQLASWLT